MSTQKRHLVRRETEACPDVLGCFLVVVVVVDVVVVVVDVVVAVTGVKTRALPGSRTILSVHCFFFSFPIL